MVNFTVNVKESAAYDIQIRYASNLSSSGPMQIELNGDTVSANVTFTSSGGWDKWSTKNVIAVPLKAGIQTMRLRFVSGGFNIGKLTFTKKSDLNFTYPTANAGNNFWVNPAASNFNLDGSKSSGSAALTYVWKQIYGPTKLIFNDVTKPLCVGSGMEKGVYKCRLTVKDGKNSDFDDVFIVVSDETNTPPNVAIVNPVFGSRVWENQPIAIKVVATDLIGSVVKVRFFINGNLTDSLLQQPFQISRNFTPGKYVLTAQAQDDSGAVVLSESVELMVDGLPSCRFPATNGDFDVVFSNDASNPTMTFQPKKAQTGTPTCILYYGGNAGNMPGYLVKPNQPFRINAVAGSSIFYYYTYTFSGLEKNTADNKGTFTIGLCKPEPSSGLETSLLKDLVSVYPNPVSLMLNVNFSGEGAVQVFSISGVAVTPQAIGNASVQLDVQNLAAGYYVVRLLNAAGISSYHPIAVVHP